MRKKGQHSNRGPWVFKVKNPRPFHCIPNTPHAKMPITAAINFSLPFVTTLLWFKPVRTFILHPEFTQLTAYEDSRLGESKLDKSATMTDNQFELLRISIIITLSLFKLATFSSFLQAHLSSPKAELDNQRQESGFMKAKQIQDEIRKVNLSSCIAALQYIAFPVFCLTWSPGATR